MMERGKKKHSYTVSLAASLLILAFGQVSGIIQKGENGFIFHFPRSVDQVQAVSEHDGAEEIQNTEERTESAAQEALPGGDTGVKTETETDQEPVMYEADTSYFEDALFIGDSRTVGLHEYGDLGGAEVIADSGMNVYKIYEKEFMTAAGDEKLLETVLSETQYGKVYLMLGINELGYDFERTVSRYQELVGRIREAQPEAKIFLQANLHITKEKSEASPIYTNENIDRFNEAVEQMADNRTIFYLDVNELFDDEEGSLSKTYTVDNAHVLGKYYADWVEWILRHAR